MKINHFATIINGQLKFNDYIKWVKQLNALSGCEVVLTIGKKTKQRSLNENAYFHGVVCEILADHFGYTLDEMKDALKWHFLRVEEAGKPPRVKSTASLTTVEFEAFLTKIREWAQAEYGVYIPLPNECELTV